MSVLPGSVLSQCNWLQLRGLGVCLAARQDSLTENSQAAEQRYFSAGCQQALAGKLVFRQTSDRSWVTGFCLSASTSATIQVIQRVVLCVYVCFYVNAVGTLVSKTMLSAANAPYAAPAPGGTLVSLDVFSLQVSLGLSGVGGLSHPLKLVQGRPRDNVQHPCRARSASAPVLFCMP